MSSSLKCYIERKLKGVENTSDNWELCGNTLHRNIKWLFEPWQNGFGYDTFMSLDCKDISLALQKELRVDEETQREWIEDHSTEETDAGWYNPYSIYTKDVSELREQVSKKYVERMIEVRSVAKSMGIPLIMDDDDGYSTVDCYEDHDYDLPCKGHVVQSVIVDQIANMMDFIDFGRIFELCDIAEEYSSEYDPEKHDFNEYDVRFIFVLG